MKPRDLLSLFESMFVIIGAIAALGATVVAYNAYVKDQPIIINIGATPTVESIVIQQTAVPLSTYTPQPPIEVTRIVTQIVEVPIVQTKVVEVTSERIVTATPLPQPTATATPLVTGAGSILEVGQTWFAEDRALTLTRVEFTSITGFGITQVIRCFFEIENKTNNQLTFELRPSHIKARSNTNVTVDFIWGSGEGTSRNISVGPRSITELNSYTGLNFPINYYDTAINEVIVTASGIPGLSEARWRIPVFH